VHRESAPLEFPRSLWFRLRTSMRTLPGASSLCALAIATLALSGGCAKIEARDLIRDGNKAYNDGRFVDAIAAYDKAETLEPDGVTMFWNRACAAEAQVLRLKEPETREERRKFADMALRDFQTWYDRLDQKTEEDEKQLHDHRLALLDADERRRGVVAYSSGNHAQAVAAAAREIGTTATIVMPADAPKLKIANTRSHGAEVVLYDRYKEDRAAIGKKIAKERALTLVPPFDDYRVMAGQGTIGLELVEDAERQGVTFDAALVPCSGGGLTSGVATALADLSPRTKVYGVEPAAFDDTARSLKAGERLANTGTTPSICDALMTEKPGELTFPILQRYVSALTVSDEEVLRAMRHAFYELKLVVEPGGAAAFAAVLSNKIDLRGKTVAVILSGGNVDAEMFDRALGAVN